MNGIERDRKNVVFKWTFLENHKCQKVLLSIFTNGTAKRIDRERVDFKSKRGRNSARRRPPV